MSSQAFFRRSGWLLLIGGILFALDTILSIIIPGPLDPDGPPPSWLAWIGALSSLLIIIGLPAAYKLHERSAKTLCKSQHSVGNFCIIKREDQRSSMPFLHLGRSGTMIFEDIERFDEIFE